MRSIVLEVLRVLADRIANFEALIDAPFNMVLDRFDRLEAAMGRLPDR
jgi:hypothetical protein